MEAVKRWPEPLLKEVDGREPPIEVRQDGANGYEDDGDEHWEDEP